MVQTCSKCSRVNPPEASYCYYDGSLLNGHGLRAISGAAISTGTQPFPTPFVFPTGQVCRNFDELALACHDHWPAAVDLLQQGYLESFLAGLGRADLGLAARAAARFPDRDRGLDQFLAQLPTTVIDPPKLDVAPHEVNLGLLQVGEDRHLELHLSNQGMRLLYGSVTCGDCVWLAVGEAPGAPHKLFQFNHELMIPVHVRGKQLRGGNKPLQAELNIESNGGLATVLVRAEVPVKPYPDGVLAGARSPRQIAEKARAAPKEAAVLFEKGAVAQWYKENGWTYPVQGPSASGLGAVQQFFEALGLTPPPKVAISVRSVALYGNVGDSLRHTLEVTTQEKRPVYAHGKSNQPWLEVGRPRLNGRTATIPLAVPSVPDREGETLRAKVTVTANGNQRFVVPVTLSVGANFHFPAGLPTAADTVAEPQLVAPTLGTHPVRARIHALPAVLLVFALLGIVLSDVLWPPTTDSGAGLRQTGPWDIKPIDPQPRIAVQFNPKERFGIVMLQESDPDNPLRRKRLTYDDRGGTNNTCLIIDGYEYLFGQTPGQWVKDQKLTPEIEMHKGRARIAAMDFPEHVRVIQTVMVVANEQTRLLDTCLVHYLIDNRAPVPHKVGIRVMIDTFIGANDGVPFAIPGQPGLLETKKRFDQKDIPDYIQALERPDLKDPGTIAHMGLKLPEFKVHKDDPELEPMESLLICRWPGNSEAKWSWQPKAMNEPPDEKKDSCVTLYWAIDQMAPGAKRAIAFTYGLGTISSTASKNAQLSLTAGGSLRPNKVFTVTAYVKNPEDGQRVKLHLPKGLVLEAGQDEEQSVDRGRGDYTQLSWRVQALKEGEYSLQVTSGAASEHYTVRIRRAGLFD